jgi:hypothetical protein
LTSRVGACRGAMAGCAMVPLCHRAPDPQLTPSGRGVTWCRPHLMEGRFWKFLSSSDCDHDYDYNRHYRGPDCEVRVEWVSWSAFTPSDTSGEVGGNRETFEWVIGAQAPHLGSRVDIYKTSTPAHHTPFYLYIIFQFERRCIGVM